jgi:glycosyltransferase involved in cell wall biosynthesis
VIEDGVTGFLIQPGDAQSLADRLKVMNERRELLLQMSLAARSRYLRQPKWEPLKKDLNLQFEHDL